MNKLSKSIITLEAILTGLTGCASHKVMYTPKINFEQKAIKPLDGNYVEITIGRDMINDVLEEGQEKTYNIGGDYIGVKADSIWDKGARISLNEKERIQLETGESYIAPNGIKVYINDVLKQ